MGILLLSNFNEQGHNTSFYFTEEILRTLKSPKDILVSDRAKLFNYLIGQNAYTISSRVLNADLNDTDVIPVRLDVDEEITVGVLFNKKGVKVASDNFAAISR